MISLHGKAPYHLQLKCIALAVTAWEFGCLIKSYSSILKEIKARKVSDLNCVFNHWIFF